MVTLISLSQTPLPYPPLQIGSNSRCSVACGGKSGDFHEPEISVILAVKSVSLLKGYANLKSMFYIATK